MSRKFISKKEIAFINRVNRELINDVIGQEVFYYQVMSEKTAANDLYNESIDKVFAPALRLNALVSYENTQEKIGILPPDSTYKIDVMFHNLELSERNLVPKMGDFIQFDNIMFEIYSVSQPQLTFGMIEQKVMTKCNCGPARKGQMSAKKSVQQSTRDDANAPLYPMQPRNKVR